METVEYGFGPRSIMYNGEYVTDFSESAEKLRKQEEIVSILESILNDKGVDLVRSNKEKVVDIFRDYEVVGIKRQTKLSLCYIGISIIDVETGISHSLTPIFMDDSQEILDMKCHIVVDIISKMKGSFEK